MRLGRRTAAIVAATSSIALVAAAAPTTGPEGTASTRMSAVELDVTSPALSTSLGVIDASTFASTSSDASLNPTAAPFASSLLTPLTGPAGPLGAVEARSDGQTQVTASGQTLSGLGGPLADLGATVAPVTMTANATAQKAAASIETLTAEIAGLAGALGLEVNVAGIGSTVDGDVASAVQGLEVSGAEVLLGDLLSEDVLATLPLPDLLALIEALPVALPVDVQSTIDQLTAALDALVAQLGLVSQLGASLDAPVSQLTSLDAAVPTITSLQRLYDDLAALDTASAAAPSQLQTISTGLAGVTDAVDQVLSGGGKTVDSVITDTLGGVTGTVGGLTTRSNHLLSADDCITDVTAVAASLDCVGDLLAATVGAAAGIDAGLVDPATALADVQTLIATLVRTINGIVTDLVREIGDLVPLLSSVDRLSLDLGDLLAALDGLLDDIAGTPLVSVSTITIGVNAVSNGSVDGATATVLCDPVTVTILDQVLTSPSCAEGLDAVRGASELVDGAVGSLVGVLNSLPLDGLVSTSDLRVGLFTDLQQSVTEADGVVTAVAGITALDLQLPSITVDPSAVTDPLAGLGLPDVLGTVEQILADALAQLQPVVDLGLGTATTALVTAETTLGVDGGLADIAAQLDALVASLDLGALGTLDRITTPAVDLRIDPVSTASFKPGAAAPVGAPEPTPSLPATGGGAVLLGLLAMGGAAGLLRRR